jgi:hypothetical protein
MTKDISEEPYLRFLMVGKYLDLNALNLAIGPLEPNECQEMMGANNFQAFKAAANFRSLQVMEALMKSAPDKIPNMIVTFRQGCVTGFI